MKYVHPTGAEFTVLVPRDLAQPLNSNSGLENYLDPRQFYPPPGGLKCGTSVTVTGFCTGSVTSPTMLAATGDPILSSAPPKGLNRWGKIERPVKTIELPRSPYETGWLFWVPVLALFGILALCGAVYLLR